MKLTLAQNNTDWLLGPLVLHLPEHREALLALADKPLSVEVKRRLHRRSIDQNARYWKIVTALAKYVGDTKAGVHEDILCEFHGYDLVTNPFTGQHKRQPRDRSHNQDVDKFGDLMAIAERWCAEGNVRWEE